MSDGLNPAQQQAVHHLHGPCLVLAGAGSGKTRVIAFKVAQLLKAGLQPSQIAAITFTNKAAAEMRERIKSLVGARAAAGIVVSTFHSLGVRMLREDGTAIGLPANFSILDADDVLAMLRDIGGCSDNAQARQWQWAISLWKNQGLGADAARAAAQDENERMAATLMARYHERLAAYRAVDFDDLIALPLKLLREAPEVRAKWQERLRHVLVDEVQDTNAVQYDLLHQLVSHPDAQRAGRFTAVGDDDQSIYGWRGATLDNLKRLQADWPALQVIPLTQNYRSTGAILAAANRLIAANPKLFEKRLWSELGEGEPIRYQEAEDDEHEAERVVAFIESLRALGGSGGTAWRDFAVLYRANHQSKPLEQKLRAAQIPYRVSGGQSFFDRAEIKDLMAWLRLVVNEDDDPAFLRAVTTPKRGIGTTTLQRLGDYAGQHKVSLFEALYAPTLGPVLGAKATAALHEFGRGIHALAEQAKNARGEEAARAVLMDWLKGIGYEQHLYDQADSPPLAAARWTNVLEFCDWAARRCGGQVTREAGIVEAESATLAEVAQTLAVIASLAEAGDERDVVTLSTLHAAKGLEWNHVFLAGVNEGLLPFKAGDDEMTADRLHEERRLMYVGITRARRTLVVSTLKRRRRGRDKVPGVPSRFVAEMRESAAEVPREDPRERLRKLRERLMAQAGG